MADPHAPEFLWHNRITGEVIRLVDVQDEIVAYVDEGGVIAKMDAEEFYKKYAGVPPDPPKPPMESGWQTKYAWVAPVAPRRMVVKRMYANEPGQWPIQYVTIVIDDEKDAKDAPGR